MRQLALAIGLLWSVACSSAPPPNPFPPEAQTAFIAACRGGEAFCACSWDKITRRFTAEEWSEALAHLEAMGAPDPRIVTISHTCREETL